MDHPRTVLGPSSDPNEDPNTDLSLVMNNHELSRKIEVKIEFKNIIFLPELIVSFAGKFGQLVKNDRFLSSNRVKSMIKWRKLSKR